MTDKNIWHHPSEVAQMLVQMKEKLSEMLTILHIKDAEVAKKLVKHLSFQLKTQATED